MVTANAVDRTRICLQTRISSQKNKVLLIWTPEDESDIRQDGSVGILPRVVGIVRRVGSIGNQIAGLRLGPRSCRFIFASGWRVMPDGVPRDPFQNPK